MAARICTQCGAPLHGNTCEYCTVEHEPEYANPFTSYEVMEVTPQQLRELRCREEFARPHEILSTQYCGVYDGKLLKMVPSREIEMRYIYDAFVYGGIAEKQLDIIMPTGKEASFEQESTGEEV